MKIEKVTAQPDRAGRYTVKWEDGSTMRLYRQTVEDFGLYAGKEMDETTLATLRTAAGQMSAKMRAVRIVSAGSVSKSDLERRLVQKGENKHDAAQAVAWMADMNLVDDQKAAQQVVQHCISKGYGIARAKQALYEKRIPKELWEEALMDYPDQTEKILAFLQNKLGESWNEKELRRTVDALLRRGHSYPEIRRALQIFSEDSDLGEEDI